MRWVGLIRNVMHGRDGLDRAGLLDAVVTAGGSHVRSHLTTGNVTFDAAEDAIDDLARRLECELSKAVSRSTMVAIREHAWLTALVGQAPFSAWQGEDCELEVAFLRRGAPPIDLGDLPPSGRTRLVAIGERELASVRPRSGPDRPHINRLLERATGQPSTARGWSTLTRISNDP